MERKRRIYVLSGVIALLVIVYGVVYVTFFADKPVEEKKAFTFTQVTTEEPIDLDAGNANDIIIESLDENDLDIGNERIIKKYYQLISEQKLSDAFAMRFEKNITFETFKKWHDSIASVIVTDIQERDEGEYAFYVSYAPIVPSKPIEFYRVSVKMHGGKLEIMALEKDFDAIGDHYVGVRRTNLGDRLYYSYKGAETTIEQYEKKDTAKPEDHVLLMSPRLLKNGAYVLYKIAGWESDTSVIYDVAKKTKVATFDAAFVDVDPNGQYLFVCSNNGMVSTAGGAVFKMTDLTTPLYDLSSNIPTLVSYARSQDVIPHISTDDEDAFLTVACAFDKEKREVVFTARGTDEKTAEVVSYAVDTGVVDVKK